MPDSSHNRRDFLESLSPVGSHEDASSVSVPTGGSTVRAATRAMACEFSIIMNPGPHERVMAVGDVLELIHDIESWLSIYKPASEISIVNQNAARQPIPVRPALFDLLQTSKCLFDQTHGAFDVAAGAQIKLWRECRNQRRIPAAAEIEDVLLRSGTQHLQLDKQSAAVGFGADGLQLDPGAIGKGYALDEAATWLQKLDGCPDEFLLHGGHSSLIARGTHDGQDGWPVGIGNPLFTKKRLGTVLLKDQAMSTSGSNIQFFRHEGRRYGHILDPRTAMPVDGMLSVTVFAESAAVADALSTAFFVLGVENAQKCCDNLPNVGAILIPFPERGAKVVPTVIRVPENMIFWDNDQVLQS
jgi:thiamine biosynthesis lipoprotein